MTDLRHARRMLNFAEVVLSLECRALAQQRRKQGTSCTLRRVNSAEDKPETWVPMSLPPHRARSAGGVIQGYRGPYPPAGPSSELIEGSEHVGCSPHPVAFLAGGLDDDTCIDERSQSSIHIRHPDPELLCDERGIYDRVPEKEIRDSPRDRSASNLDLLGPASSDVVEICDELPP